MFSLSFRPLPIAGICLVAAALVTPALAADVTLEDVTQTGAQSTLTFPRIEITDTNVSRDELAALFTGKLDGDASAALIGRLKAAKIAIPEVRLAIKGGTISARDLVATNIDTGKAARVALASADGALVTDKGAPLTFHTNALSLEGISVGGLIALAKSRDPADLQLRMDRATWGGFEATVADSDTPKDAVGGNLWRVRLGGIDATTSWSGDVPLAGKGTVSNFVIEPPRASEPGRVLAAYGWERLDFGMTVSSAYDPAARTYTIGDYTLSEAKSGALKLSTRIGSVDGTVFTGTKEQRLAALLQSDVSRVVLRFDDTGLFAKAVEFFAASSHLSPDAIRKQWSAAATQFVPLLLAGDPSGLKIAAAVNAFIAKPGSLQISADAKGPPIKFEELDALKEDPSRFLERVELDATATP